MNFAELSAQRYSLRKFSDRPVEDALLQQVLEAGRNAPTAHNNQPQRIFVLQSPEAMAKADACMGCHFHPPVLLTAAFPEMAGLVPIAMLPLGYPAEGAHPARLHTDRKPMEQLVKYL